MEELLEKDNQNRYKYILTLKSFYNEAVMRGDNSYANAIKNLLAKYSHPVDD